MRAKEPNLRAKGAVVICFGCKGPLFSNSQLMRCYNVEGHGWKWPTWMTDEDWKEIDENIPKKL